MNGEDEGGDNGRVITRMAVSGHLATELVVEQGDDGVQQHIDGVEAHGMVRPARLVVVPPEGEHGEGSVAFVTPFGVDGCTPKVVAPQLQGRDVISEVLVVPDGRDVVEDQVARQRIPVDCQRQQEEGRAYQRSAANNRCFPPHCCLLLQLLLLVSRCRVGGVALDGLGRRPLFTDSMSTSSPVVQVKQAGHIR